MAHLDGRAAAVSPPVGHGGGPVPGWCVPGPGARYAVSATLLCTRIATSVHISALSAAR